MISDYTIFFVFLGFLYFLLIVLFVILGVIWYRKNLVVIKIITHSNKIETLYFKKNKISTMFTYKNCVYQFDAKNCFYDKWNRLTAFYVEDNPKQLILNKEKCIFLYDDIKPDEFKFALESNIASQILSSDVLDKYLIVILIMLIIVLFSVFISDYFFINSLKSYPLSVSNESVVNIVNAIYNYNVTKI